MVDYTTPNPGEGLHLALPVVGGSADTWGDATAGDVPANPIGLNHNFRILEEAVLDKRVGGTIDGNLFVNGDTTFTGDVIIVEDPSNPGSGNLTLQDGSLTITEGDVIITNGGLTVNSTDPSSLGGDLTIDGLLTLIAPEGSEQTRGMRIVDNALTPAVNAAFFFSDVEDVGNGDVDLVIAALDGYTPNIYARGSDGATIFVQHGLFRSTLTVDDDARINGNLEITTGYVSLPAITPGSMPGLDGALSFSTNRGLLLYRSQAVGDQTSAAVYSVIDTSMLKEGVGVTLTGLDANESGPQPITVTVGWGSDEKASLGDLKELEIWHDGVNGYIENDVGALYITSDIVLDGDLDTVGNAVIDGDLEVTGTLTVAGQPDIGIPADATWQAFTPSFDTVYTNGAGHQIMVSLGLRVDGSGGSLSVECATAAGSFVPIAQADNEGPFSVQFVVQPGHRYRVTTGGSASINNCARLL